MELYSIGNNNSYALFEEKFLHVLNKQLRLKIKLLQYNNAFMSKELRKRIILRSKVRNVFDKNRSYKIWCNVM